MQVLLNVCIQGNVLSVSLWESNGFLFQLVFETFTFLVLDPPPLSAVFVDVVPCQFFSASSLCSETVSMCIRRWLGFFSHGRHAPGFTGLQEGLDQFYAFDVFFFHDAVVVYVLELFIQLSRVDVECSSSSSSTWT